MKVQDLQGDHSVRVSVGGQATAGTADEFVIASFGRNVKVTGVKWIPAAAVTGAATNNFALGVVNKGAAAAGTTAVTPVVTYGSGTNSVAFVAEDYTLSSTAADLLVTAGDILTLKRTINGSGLAMPKGTVEVKFQYR